MHISPETSSISLLSLQQKATCHSLDSSPITPIHGLQSRTNGMTFEPSILKMSVENPQTIHSNCVNLVENRWWNKLTLTENKICYKKPKVYFCNIFLTRENNILLGERWGIEKTGPGWKLLQQYLEWRACPWESPGPCPTARGTAPVLCSAGQSTLHAQLLQIQVIKVFQLILKIPAHLQSLSGCCPHLQPKA